MEAPLLNDKDQVPTEEIIFSHIGKARTQWKALFGYIDDAFPDFAGEWRFYNDGKQWLLKTTRKSKTIFWTSVMRGTFTTTFYFGDKAEPAILASTLSDPLKDAFRNGPRYGKIRGITVHVRKKSDVEDVKALIAIRLSIK